MKRNQWFTYVLECADGTFYVGITNDLDERLKKHNRGVASRYTRSRLPVRFRYAERQADRSSALKREMEVKKWRKARKMTLFSSRANVVSSLRRRHGDKDPSP